MVAQAANRLTRAAADHMTLREYFKPTDPIPAEWLLLLEQIPANNEPGGA